MTLQQRINGHGNLISVLGASVGTQTQLFSTTKKVACQDFPEGVSELPDAVSIDNGVDGRVGMREYNGHVHDFGRLLYIRKECEAVEDMHRQPAQGKEAYNNGQGLGGTDFALQEPTMVLVLATLAVAHHASELDLPQLLPSHCENLYVNA